MGGDEDELRWGFRDGMARRRGVGSVKGRGVVGMDEVNATLTHLVRE